MIFGKVSCIKYYEFLFVFDMLVAVITIFQLAQIYVITDFYVSMQTILTSCNFMIRKSLVKWEFSINLFAKHSLTKYTKLWI